MEQLTPLAPLQASVDYWNDIDKSSVESELKRLFIALFQQFLRTQFRRIDHYGYPHLLDSGDFETVQRFIKSDGLNLLNRGDDKQAYMSEVFRAWRGQHSSRGLAFIKFYLQMLWPNAWAVTQYWHSVPQSVNYPASVTEQETPNSFLTSRVSVTIDPDALTDQSEVLRMIPALRRVVPARIVLSVAIGVNVEPMGVVIGMAASPIACMSFEDVALL